MAVKLGDALGFAAHQRKCLMSALTHPDRQPVVGGLPSELDKFTPLLDHHVGKYVLPLLLDTLLECLERIL